MSINKKAPTFRDRAHTNFMGGKSYDITNPILRLHVAAASSFFGEAMYYHDKNDKPARPVRGAALQASSSIAGYLTSVLGASVPPTWGQTPAQMMVSAIDAALAFDPEATLQEAVNLRQVDNMRATPQVILVRASHLPALKGTGLVRKYGQLITQRLDEVTTQFAYHLEAYGDKVAIPMSLRRVWGDKLNTATEYQLAKYRMEARQVKLVDVVNMAHGLKAGNEALDKLVKGEAKNTGNTWESIISQDGSTKENWEKAIGVAGHFAMVRNVRNFLKMGVDPDLFIEKLKAGVATGRLLPFRYLSAYNALHDQTEIIVPGRVMDALEECLMLSVANMPFLGKKVAAISDNSGSAHGAPISEYSKMTVAQIGNLTAVLAALRSDDGVAGVFGDRYKSMSIRKTASVMDQAKKLGEMGSSTSIGHSTEHGIWLFWDEMIRDKIWQDTVFIFSDQQAGHGGLYGVDVTNYGDYIWRGSRNIDVPKLIQKYRQTVNPNVNVFLVQVAGYQDTIVPEFFDKTYILGGWGPGLFEFAGRMIELTQPKLPEAVKVDVNTSASTQSVVEPMESWQ